MQRLSHPPMTQHTICHTSACRNPISTTHAVRRTAMDSTCTLQAPAGCTTTQPTNHPVQKEKTMLELATHPTPTSRHNQVLLGQKDSHVKNVTVMSRVRWQSVKIRRGSSRQYPYMAQPTQSKVGLASHQQAYNCTGLGANQQQRTTMQTSCVPSC